MFGTKNKKQLKRIEERTRRELEFIAHMISVYDAICKDDPSNTDAKKQYDYYLAQKEIVETIVGFFED